MRWDAVLFDFDGVIVDSVNIKTEAFAQMFRPFGREVEESVVRFHLENGGMSRYDKFRYWYKNYLGIEIDKKKIEELSIQFSNIVLEKVIAAEYIPGAVNTLQKLNEHGIPCFIVSATPSEEIQLIVNEKKINHFFCKVLGSPATKEQNINTIIRKYGYDRERCLFFGDSMQDYLAAKNTGIKFIGIIRDKMNSSFPDGVETSTRVDCDIEIEIRPQKVSI